MVYSQQISSLLSVPDIGLSYNKSGTFINARFRTIEDLTELDNLVQEARQNQELIKANLVASQFQIDALLTDSKELGNTCLASAQELSLLRHSVTDEITELSNELISAMSDESRNPTLLEDIESLHRSLKELKSLKEYVQVIRHALRLRESALEQIQKALYITEESVSEYIILQKLVTEACKLSLNIENGYEQRKLHIIVFLEDIQEKTWTDMKNILSSTLLTSAEKMGWPMPLDYVSATLEDRRAFEKAFTDLLKLQKIGRSIHSPSSATLQSNHLYPLESLIKPISLRFKYHFDGGRQTNRLDKPEWFFTHILNIAHDHHQFMDVVVQELLKSSEYRNISAWREFTSLLLPLLSRKLSKSIPSILSHPSLLAHTIYQALAFDATIVEEGFQIQGTTFCKQNSDDDKWGGVSETILGNQEWFEAWVSGEKQFVDDQYREIVGASDAWLLADDEANGDAIVPHGLKSTNSARRVKSLVEQVTERYSLLPHSEQRIHFLVSIQMPLLDLYRSRISSSLDAFESLSSAFVRAVPGALAVSLGGNQEGAVNVDARDLTSGTDGLQRLCKALLSATFIATSMERWGEELFYLELWSEISENPALRARVQDNPLLPDPAVMDGTGMPHTTVFDEVRSRYQELVTRAEDMIVQQTCGEVESRLKSHFSSSSSVNSRQDDIPLSQTLLAPVALLSSCLTFLRMAVSQLMFTVLYRRIASRLAEHILQRQILYRGHFGLPEGRVIRAECELWVEACQGVFNGLNMSRQRVESPWLKLLQAGRLAGAEGNAWEKVVHVAFGSDKDETWKETIEEITGLSELPREDVIRVLKRREDCPA